MDIAPSEVELLFFRDENPVYADGYYQQHEGKYRIWSNVSNLDDPLNLVATFAHELGHVHLLGHGRVTTDVEDHEPLTDLLTVFMGFGVINSNAVLREQNTKLSLHFSRWRLSRHGYMNMRMYAYALARFAHDRGEVRPSWAKELRADVAADFRKTMEYFDGPVTPIPSSLESVRWSDLQQQPAKSDQREKSEEELSEKSPPAVDPFADAISSADSRAAKLRNRYQAGERSFVDGDFQRLALAGIDLSNCILRNADLSECDLTDAILDNADLRTADLSRCRLRGAKLRCARLQEADFRRADLTGADLTGADIRQTNFTRACLQQTILTETIRCSRTNFSGVDLETIICDKDLNRENLSGVSNSSPIASGVGVSGRIWFFCLLFAGACIFGGLSSLVADSVMQFFGVSQEVSERWSLLFAAFFGLLLMAWVLWPRSKKTKA